MEWLEGDDLRERLRRGPLAIGETLAIAPRLAEALAAAHARGIVHRDVKPSNLFLPDGRRRARQAARLRHRALPSGDARGDPHRDARSARRATWRPSRRAASASIDARADVFALGCVLFECLTGQAAVRRRRRVAILLKILLEEPPRAARRARSRPGSARRPGRAHAGQGSRPIGRRAAQRWPPSCASSASTPPSARRSASRRASSATAERRMLCRAGVPRAPERPRRRIRTRPTVARTPGGRAEKTAALPSPRVTADDSSGSSDGSLAVTLAERRRRHRSGRARGARCALALREALESPANRRRTWRWWPGAAGRRRRRGGARAPRGARWSSIAALGVAERALGQVIERAVACSITRGRRACASTRSPPACSTRASTSAATPAVSRLLGRARRRATPRGAARQGHALASAASASSALLVASSTSAWTSRSRARCWSPRPPGVGKSRLRYEFAAAAARSARDAGRDLDRARRPDERGLAVRDDRARRSAPPPACSSGEPPTVRQRKLARARRAPRATTTRRRARCRVPGRARRRCRSPTRTSRRGAARRAQDADAHGRPDAARLGGLPGGRVRGAAGGARARGPALGRLCRPSNLVDAALRALPERRSWCSRWAGPRCTSSSPSSGRSAAREASGSRS